MRKDELLDTLRRSFDGQAWHGPSVAEAISGVSQRMAAQRPPGNAHSIWELTLHIASWSNEVTRRLHGNEPAEPEEGDYPKIEGSWEDAPKRVAGARDRALAIVEKLTEGDLDKRVGEHPDAALGTGFTYAGMIEGLAQHNAYHAGQISILKRILKG